MNSFVVTTPELLKIDRACEAFEIACEAKIDPKIEDYLPLVDTHLQSELWAELVQIEVERLQTAGGRPEYETYRNRMPQFAYKITRDWFTAPSAHVTFVAGAPVGKYSLIQELGRGACGTVWLAAEDNTGRQVALKLFHHCTAASLRGEVVHGSASHEANISAQLKHPNLVPLIETGQIEGTDFVASEYIEGVTLNDWIRTNRPNFHTIAEMLLEASKGVGHAHQRGFVHRDLKPSNIIIGRNGSAYVTDFGMAKNLGATNRITSTGRVMGTLGYMSPEQIVGKSCLADSRSDVFSIGVILYEMLSGRRPFEGDAVQVAHATLNLQPRSPRSFNSEVPTGLDRIAMKCLSKDASRRYTSAIALAKDLERFIADQPVHARRLGTIEKIRDSVHLHRREAVVLGTMVTMGATWAIWKMSGSSSLSLPAIRVRIPTNPERCDLTIFPLNRLTGFPETPIQATSAKLLMLRPGDYKVIARIGDRFHEVNRRVPGQPGEEGFYMSPPWSNSFDAEGTYLTLKEINLPQSDVTNGMVFVKGDNRLGVESFYVDPTEFTERQYLHVLKRFPSDLHFRERGGDRAIRLRYDLAEAAAEAAGKRLPTEAEFTYLATSAQSRQLVQDSSPAESMPDDYIGDVKQPSCDVFALESGSVWGILSNVAEWTTSRPAEKTKEEELPPNWQDPFTRVVKGGSQGTVNGDPKITNSSRSPKNRVGVRGDSWNDGVGFRCVRSAAVPLAKNP